MLKKNSNILWSYFRETEAILNKLLPSRIVGSVDQNDAGSWRPSGSRQRHPTIRIQDTSESEERYCCRWAGACIGVYRDRAFMLRSMHHDTTQHEPQCPQVSS